MPQVRGESHGGSDDDGSASDASLQKWSSGRPRGRRKAKEAGAPGVRGRGGRRGRGRGRGPAGRKSNGACKETPYIPLEYQVSQTLLCGAARCNFLHLLLFVKADGKGMNPLRHLSQIQQENLVQLTSHERNGFTGARGLQ